MVAALAAIDAGGLASLRARGLAEQAGCAVGAIYGLFPDLDALVLAANADTLDSLAATLAQDGPAADPVDELRRLARAYLGFARSRRERWRALFGHRLPPGRDFPPDYAARLQAAFTPVEAPLALLLPGAGAAAGALLARTLFSAVHGVVDLGLDEKLTAIDPDTLSAQLDTLVRAAAAGLATSMPAS